MENKNRNNELFNLADDMNLSIMVVGRDCLIKGINRQGEKLLDSLGVDRTKPCPSLFKGFGDPCLFCPFNALEESGRLSTIKEQTMINGQVKKVVYRLTEDKDAVFIVLMNLNEDSQSKSLLKQSERTKRVVLDNLNSSFLIINEEGEVERSHFVGELSDIMRKRGFSPYLDKIFNREISHTVLSRIQSINTKKNKDLCRFRFEFKGQILWLDFLINSMEEDKYFLSIVDKTFEHDLLVRMELLNEAEVSCAKINKISSKLSHLMGGLSRYAELAIKKSSDPTVLDILNSMKQITEDSLNTLKMVSTPSSHLCPIEQSNLPSNSHKEKRDTFKTSPFLSTDKALELLENNNELYQTVVEDFINDYGNAAERLGMLFESDHEGAQILVHSIKGVAGILGAYSLQNEANLLEGYIRHEDWTQAERSRMEFSKILTGVLKELKYISRKEGKLKDSDRWSLHGMSLNKHQKDLLLENIPLAEAGDYNGLRDNLQQFSSFDWGHDWTEIIRILTEQIENIDFEGVLQSINTLVK